MDFKGIAWVGNVYQKFEAMCLELEEAMYQDTVKYVENQVRTICTNVKDFYSDAMHDFLPPSSVDPVKLAAADFSPNPYAHDVLHKKPKPEVKENAANVTKKVTDYSKVTAAVDTNHMSSFSGLFDVNQFPPPSFRGSVKGVISEIYSEQNKDGGICRHSKGWSRASSCSELIESHGVVSDRIARISTPTSIEVKGCESAGGGREGGTIDNNCIDDDLGRTDASIDLRTCDSIIFFDSASKKATELRHTCPSGSIRSEYIGSSTSRNWEFSESAAEEIHGGSVADSNADVVHNNTESGKDTIVQFDEVEETCVLVDGYKLRFVLNREGKHKSYRKKIRDAFSAKMRTARKQEYEQLALRFGYIDTGLNQESAERDMPCRCIMDSNSLKLPSQNSCESEWELL